MQKSRILKLGLLILYCLSLMLTGIQNSLASTPSFAFLDDQGWKYITRKQSFCSPDQSSISLNTSKKSGQQNSWTHLDFFQQFGCADYSLYRHWFFFRRLFDSPVFLKFSTTDIAYSFHAFW